jgi:endoglucanase
LIERLWKTLKILFRHGFSANYTANILSMKCTVTTALLVFVMHSLLALPPATFSKHIKIDQFGYLPLSKKVAVIADPQTGYNAAESFTPGTGANQYQVRRWSDDAVVFSGTLAAWNSGATHAQSGDRGWWFDFSALTTTGSYYIYDVANNVGSYRFEINTSVYAELLKVASRMYFYQRVNHAKQPPYVDSRWADAASFEGANQDKAARSRWDKNNPATARDVSGGWYDAGDYNKYISFAFGPMCNLMETYRMHPAYFTDDYNIPESGNGIPDILDEVKWEMDFFKRMQDATGTNGLFLKVGADNYNSAAPPSADNNPRYYVPECTSATLTGAAVFALGSTVYKSLGNAGMTAYGNDLLTRGINAWNRAKITTANFTIFETTCDDQNIVAGDADQGVEDQQDMIVTAAAYLYEATGSSEYKNAFDTMYLKARPYAYWWWGPYFSAVQRALLRYTLLSGASTTVANNIRTVKAGQNGVLSINEYNSNTDLYRSSMPDAQYHWNSHEVKSNAGLDNMDFVTFNINTAQQAQYKEVAESYLHWFHGINPMGKVMLSNMYAYGADSSVNEFYHSWFNNGTVWDNVFTSPNGPAPGYLIGGPNKDFSIPGISPPGGQPPQKSYKEWNTGWNGTANENSWEITEAGIYTQAAYISLLVRVMANAGGTVLAGHNIQISAVKQNAAVLVNWQAANTGDIFNYELQRSTNGRDFATCFTTAASAAGMYTFTDAAVAAGKVFYRVKEINISGAYSYSAIVKIENGNEVNDWGVYPNPVQSTLVIWGTKTKKGITMLELTDANGKRLRTVNWQQDAGAFSKAVDGFDVLPAGTYHVVIKQDGIPPRVFAVTKLPAGK